MASGGISGARLRGWARLGEARAPGRGVRAVVGVGVIATATAWVALAPGASAAGQRWLAVAVVVLAALGLAIPQWIFWRRDAGLIARLPVPGAALLGAAVRRAARGGSLAALALVVAAAPLAAWSAPVAARHGLVGVALAIATAALMPAVAVAAAALVASGQLAALGRSLGGEVRAPATSWLGVLPGLAAAAVLLVLVALAPWATRGAPTLLGDGAWVVAATPAAALLALAVAARGGAGLAVALREVAALDRVRLAHLEILPPSAVERLLIAAIGPRAGVLLSKDARLMRRRYPMAWVVGAALWGGGAIVAWGEVATPTTWTLALGGGGGAYLVVLALRLAAPPIDAPRLRASLPLAARATVRARRAWLGGWAGVFAAPALGLAAVGAPTSAALGAAALAVALVAAAAVAAR